MLRDLKTLIEIEKKDFYGRNSRGTLNYHGLQLALRQFPAFLNLEQWWASSGLASFECSLLKEVVACEIKSPACYDKCALDSRVLPRVHELRFVV